MGRINLSSNKIPPEPYRCNTCGMVFESLGEMKYHAIEHLQKGENPSAENQ